MEDLLVVASHTFDLRLRAVFRDEVSDASGEQRVLLRIRPLLEVVIDAGGDRFARHFFGALPGVEDKRERVSLLSESFQKLDTVQRRHVEVGDDTVELVCLQQIEDRRAVGLGRDFDLVALSLQVDLHQIAEIRLIVHMEDGDSRYH
nr:hypothetical protein [Halorubrum sp. JWXQ-INN 858]